MKSLENVLVRERRRWIQISALGPLSPGRKTAFSVVRKHCFTELVLLVFSLEKHPTEL